MKYKLKHRTRYQYHNLVNSYHSIACLQPINNQSQHCESFDLVILPSPAEIIKRIDYFGNTTHYFSISTVHKELMVEATSIVESFPKIIPTQNIGITCKESHAFFEQNPAIKNTIWQYFIKSHFVEWDTEIKNFAQPSFTDDAPLYECVRDLCHRIFTEFEFNSNYTDVNTPIKVVLEERKGVCQDFSHLAIACIRSMGFAARYVSGYLETQPPKGKPKLQGSDASHAWISVYIPNIGWCEFDPTNDMIPQERHIITAYGRDYSDVAPLKGIIFSSGGHRLSVEVDVIPV